MNTLSKTNLGTRCLVKFFADRTERILGVHPRCVVKCHFFKWREVPLALTCSYFRTKCREMLESVLLYSSMARVEKILHARCGVFSYFADECAVNVLTAHRGGTRPTARRRALEEAMARARNTVIRWRQVINLYFSHVAGETSVLYLSWYWKDTLMII